MRWDPAWRRFSWYNAGFSAALGGGALGILLGSDHRQDGYRGGILLDEVMRDALLARTRRGREVARIISDRLFQYSAVYPYVVDTMALAWLGHDAGDVALQMMLINLQSQGFAAVIGLSTAHFIGRARPSVEACEQDPGYERHCGAEDRFASFMSGHTATVATTAGLVCAHNSKLPLWGDTGLGLAECVITIGAATAAGLGRIIADRHWHSDVVSGMTLGASAGYVLPMLLHYGWSDSGPPFRGSIDSDDGSMRTVIAPFASADGGGLGWAGVF